MQKVMLLGIMKNLPKTNDGFDIETIRAIRNILCEAFVIKHIGNEMNELGVFEIEDGETHWLVATSIEDTKQIMVKEYCADVENIEYIKQVPNDMIMTVYLPDEFEEDLLPTKPYQDDEGDWYCKATVAEWLTVIKHGWLVASTVY